MKIEKALELNRKTAFLGKDASFSKWWFFDTNCLSELIKLSMSGYSKEVSKFINGKDILILSSVIQELRKNKYLIDNFDNAFKEAMPFLVADCTKFWYTDIINYLNVGNEIKMNSLQTYRIKKGFLCELKSNSDFNSVCKSADDNVQKEFLNRINPDIGASLDETALITIIFSRILQYAKNNFKIEIPHADCTYNNFPSFFVFYYAYYFRYIRNKKASPEINDFIDLSNTLAAPYCERYFCESKFANLLRLQVKNHIPPSAFNIAKKMYKEGMIESERFEKIKNEKEKFNKKPGLLPNTEIVKFSEMKKEILNN